MIMIVFIYIILVSIWVLKSAIPRNIDYPSLDDKKELELENKRKERINLEKQKEKLEKENKEKAKEMEGVQGDDSMDRSRFSTPEWEGPPESQKGPMQSTPRSILTRGATIEELVDEDVLVLDDDGLGIRDPSMVQAERNRILKDVFIDQGKKTRKPSYIVPEVASREKPSKMDGDDFDSGLDIVLQKIFDTKVTLTIKELTAISPALAKAVSEGNFGEIPLKSLKTPSVRANAGKLRTSKGQMDGLVRKYREGEYLEPEDVYSFLQSKKLSLYSCPLGYVDILFDESGIVMAGLVDSGSQINLMTDEKAYSLGLRVQVNIKMKLTGISNNEAALIGIVEDVTIVIAGRVWGKAHFWITNGDVPLILGRPFLVDFEANLNFSEKYGETMVLVDGRGMGLRIPTCDPYHDEYLRTLPGQNWIKCDGLQARVHHSKVIEEEDCSKIQELNGQETLKD